MLDKNYQPSEIEARIYAKWEQNNVFSAGRSDRANALPYTVVIPPPNVTGSLHMGHALNNTLQDILCRFERMRGRDVLWQPGTDHAGIATQMVVTRQLAEKQIDYRALGRKKFISEVWNWKEESGNTIITQLKRLGTSCDWSRERFTMDAGLSQAVLKVFVDLYNDGLIYKDKRLVNWDPTFESAISDLEVESRNHTGTFKWSFDNRNSEGQPVEFNTTAFGKTLDRDPSGHMYYLRYPLANITYDSKNPATYLIVGTTRPETILGDTGVAIHPHNAKLCKFIGKYVALPLTDRVIPIISDTYADPEKGTGAVKITPAHDFNDWEVGKRAKLDVINILDKKGRLNDSVSVAYRGLNRLEARKKVVADLAALGLLDKIEPHTHSVPHAQRGDAIIEPWLTSQWYVDTTSLALPALEAVRTGKTKFHPKKYEADYFRWLENIQPWCISRQLWWGHQIPAWYGPDDKVFVALNEETAIKMATEYYGRVVELIRDEDVLDTWFSSGLWAFSTLGWPNETPDEVRRYYPTNCLVTAFDIIFFWVARMMMQSLHFMGDVPFRNIYIHGLVRDEKGRKMSKSIGNVIDPLELIDQYGADALRFTLAALATQGRDVKLTKRRVVGYRNFVTKLWNAARFAEMNECVTVEGFTPKSAEHTVNQWIAGETERTIKSITSALEVYRFNDAANEVYDFVWGVFCDWYLELIKPILNGDDTDSIIETRAMAAWVRDQILKMLHPFMPFITEELWERVSEHGPKREGLLALSEWPDLNDLSDEHAAAEIGWVIRLVSEVRSVRSEMNVPAHAKITLELVDPTCIDRKRGQRHQETIERMARLDHLSFVTTASSGSAAIVFDETTAALPLEGVIDMKAERSRLHKEIEKSRSEIAKVRAKLANPGFMAKAPEAVVEENRDRQSDFEDQVRRFEIALERLDKAM
ncbi:MAG: Valine--tRNA ligase [Hyphomicrobiaceae bacterium hypho_1]